MLDIQCGENIDARFNPTTFYNREDRWEIPHELYRSTEIAMLPYYVTTQLPGSDKPEFLFMLPLSFAGKNQMAGWLAGLSDGENYAKMVAFRFPKGTFIDGPAQVESRISSDSRFSGDLTLWDQHGSQVIRGNLIVLPLVDNQLIMIEPVYIEAEQTKIPMLARVVLGQLLPDDRKIEWASTLTDAAGSSSVLQRRHPLPQARPLRELTMKRCSAHVHCSARCSGNMPPATSRATASFFSSSESCSCRNEILLFGKLLLHNKSSGSEIMRTVSEVRRGRLKIFLGAAPGVGKTYEMVQAAQSRHRSGVDVVIGLIETHGSSVGQIDAAHARLCREIHPPAAVEYRRALGAELLGEGDHGSRWAGSIPRWRNSFRSCAGPVASRNPIHCALHHHLIKIKAKKRAFDYFMF